VSVVRRLVGDDEVPNLPPRLQQRGREYPISPVRSETNAVKAAGFPLELIVKPGEHSEAHTAEDLQKCLLHIEEG